MLISRLSGPSYACLMFALAIQCAFAQQQPQTDLRPLLLGQPVERELRGDEAHSYRLALQAGQFLDMVVEQRGIDVVVTLFDPNNQKLMEVDSPNGTLGPEPLSLITETSGNYRVEVRSLEKLALAGRYEARIIELRTATGRDKNKINAQKTFAEAETLRMQRTAESLRGAIKKYEEALLLFHSVGDKNGEATALNDIGLLYDNLGDKQRALEYFAQTLSVRRAINDKDGEGTTLNNIGNIYSDQGDKQKALGYYTQALPLLRSAGDKGVEAITLNNIGAAYRDLGERKKALEFYAESLPLHRAVGNTGGEATTLNNIGAVYGDLNEKQKAIEYYAQALPLRRAIDDKSGEAQTLSNIGFIYYLMGEQQKALDYYNQAVALQRVIGYKRGEAITLNNIGAVYSELGETQKALEYYNLAMPLLRALGDKNHEASTLNNIGRIYDKSGDQRKALEQYARVLLLLRAAGDQNGEAVALNNFFYVWRELGNARLSFFYGKLSVIQYQLLRATLKGLDKNIQRSFLKSIEYSYRKLADYLLAEKHFAEAQQILNLFKDQQYFDFNSTNQSSPLTMTKRETALAAELNRNLEGVVGAMRRLDDLKRSIGTRSPTPAEADRVRGLETGLQTANDEYQAFLRAAEQQFAAPPDELDKLPTTADLQTMQAALSETSAATKQKTIAVYTLVGEDNYRALIVTPDDIFSVSNPVKGADLNQKALQLWSLLRTPKYDPQPAANELYKIVFEPIAAQLPKDTRTILWSLDGNLRYIPMAALHDGEKYLVERFENVIFTRADRDRMTRAVNPNPTGTGFGSSEAHTVELLGAKYNASALPSVKIELGRIFKKENPRGVLAGGVLLDKQFTKTAMLAELKARHPLVHIASHFRFEPGDEARSFLLLGDGSPFTLDEMKQNAELFSGVDLLTLSACQTAAQRADANGREVDGFAELAQRLGAGAVMASLWEVSDNSTAELMTRFYRDYRGSAGENKAEALRRAQLALLKGKYNANSTDSGRQAQIENGEGIQVDQSKQKLYRADRKAPFAHPFYWSPFILIGNWK